MDSIDFEIKILQSLYNELDSFTVGGESFRIEGSEGIRIKQSGLKKNMGEYYSNLILYSYEEDSEEYILKEVFRSLDPSSFKDREFRKLLLSNLTKIEIYSIYFLTNLEGKRMSKIYNSLEESIKTKIKESLEKLGYKLN